MSGTIRAGTRTSTTMLSLLRLWPMERADNVQNFIQLVTTVWWEKLKIGGPTVEATHFSKAPAWAWTFMQTLWGPGRLN